MLPSCERATSPVSRTLRSSGRAHALPSQVLTHLIFGIDVCTALEQQAHDGGVSGSSRAVQGCALVLVPCTVQLSSRAEQRVHGRSIANVRRSKQIRCHDAAARGSALPQIAARGAVRTGAGAWQRGHSFGTER